MLILKRNEGEEHREAVERIARTRETDATVDIILNDYDLNIVAGMKPNEAALDTLFGWDFDDVSEEVEDDYNEEWGFPKKEGE